MQRQLQTPDRAEKTLSWYPVLFRVFGTTPRAGDSADRQKPGMPVLSHRFEFLVESGRARVLVISVELTRANKERIFQRAQGEATQAVSSKRAHVLVLIGLI